MKNIITLLFSIAVCNFTLAATTINSTSVTGHWTLSGSPYYVYNTISIEKGQSLIIDPGVDVIFRGDYSIIVWGTMQAAGTALNPINFYVKDTTGWYVNDVNTYGGGWRGIYFGKYDSTAPDISALRYCSFKYMKYSGVTVERSMHIQNCVFSDNKGRSLILKGRDGGVHELNNCSFTRNFVQNGGMLNISTSKVEWYVHDNELNNNTVGLAGALLSCDSSVLLFSKNNVYNNNVIPIIDSHASEASLLVFQSFNEVPCYAVISQNRIFENEGAQSATITCSYAVVDIDRNYICNNRTTQFSNCPILYGGGALYLQGCGDYYNVGIGNGRPSLYTVRNNIIANNYSAVYGGGIAVYNAKILIANNTIVNNRAPRGGGIDVVTGRNTTTCIRNNIFYGNVTENSLYGTGDVSLKNYELTNFKYDYNWSAYSFSSGVVKPSNIPGPVNLLGDTSTNIVGLNPGMVSPTLTADYTESALTADFSLLPGSACINKATHAAVVAGSVDYAGNYRLGEDSADIGAYEYNSTASGNGAKTPVDTIFTNCCTVIPPYVGIHTTQQTTESNMDIYPNPATDIVFVRTPGAGGMIQLSDALGRVVISKNVTGAIASFDIHSLQHGIYYAVWIDANSNKTTKKLIVE